ncbi:uncharacterized protein Z520_11399 [Fonsecaea multimorphosa CBS 102226]|uniref:Box C/D snoRNA protein 1 n=1 Tax=Fonsecaea multimorphosa CBS 102226 TaxID=1442371 RepID=A0A0D2K996_9EURO|nr:uncharacterized protein Z520_11399 [Fonsecaea multimorphosa CBS 102226]KIX92923.1 hypothetical protein Z520_11399 [Fonsecaea multimorphosa CBS 102226]OAL18172.1 hypothetical protein AYO22_10949 [Fonsecaea multimorphosa]
MQETSADVLLTDLCAICHVNPIKYTCPRCGVHTCSLPCVKRHKSWAQCSGVRDPSAYRKRADLATPSSVDQDFNFITSVERSLARADELTQSKGIDLVPSGLVRKGQDAKRKFDAEIEKRGISLIRAPLGLSRHKQNKSHWAGHGKCLMWTTEWLCYDGDKRTCNVLESRTVEEAFLIAFGKHAINRKKRKRSDAETTSVSAPRPTDQYVPPVAAREVNGRTSHAGSLEGNSQNPESESTAHELVTDQKRTDTTHSPTQRNGQHPGTLYSSQNLNFYLFKPNTISKVKCVIPVASDSKLVDVLRNQTILEFPTFYVGYDGPEGLPDPYITEEDYNKQYGAEVPINLPTYDPRDKADEENLASLDNIDEKKVLEVLQKDLDG